MTRRTRTRPFTATLGALAFIIALPFSAMAEDPANDEFERTWERTDRPVATSDVSRTWAWGPSGFTPDCMEPYYTSTAGEREVQYFDKSRMEITDPLADSNSDWYVTQGLLATEMITGRMQIGDHEYLDWRPADVHIAGDAGGGAPSYSDFAGLMDAAALGQGEAITQTMDSTGSVGDDPSLADYGVTAEEYVDDTDHRIASVFWDFMNSQGPIVENGVSTNGPMFSNPFYAVGFPLTEAYWTNVKVGGNQQNVLVQAFQRRVLTYTPGNEDGWQVEAGNVGRHYYMWRYGQVPEDSAEACADTMHVTFHVYEPAGDGDWNKIAITVTREVWHPGGVTSGVWITYAEGDGENLPDGSRGIMRAEHSYSNQILESLTADITQVDGPVGGSAQISAGNFAAGSHPGLPGSQFTGSGSLSYDTGVETGSVSFEVAGSSLNSYHVFLDGSAPPVFFQ